MKTDIRLPLLIFLSISFFATDVLAQNKNDQIAQENRQAKELVELFEQLKVKAENNLDKNKPCSAAALAKMKKDKYKFDINAIKSEIKGFIHEYYGSEKAYPKIQEQAKNNLFPSNRDFAMSILSEFPASMYKDNYELLLRKFIETYTGKAVANFTKKEYNRFSDYIRDQFSFIFLTTYLSEDSYDRRSRELYYEYNVDSNKDCRRTFRVTLNPKKVAYPEFIWELQATFFRKCLCNENSTFNDLYYYNVTIEAELQSVFTTRGLEIGKIAKEQYYKGLSCCSEPPKKVEDPKMEPNPKKDKSYMPNNYSPNGQPINYNYIPASMVGTGVGLGFEDNFKEIKIMGSLEYLYLLKLKEEVEDFLWFIGADVEASTIISEFYNNRSFKFGPKLQLHKRLPRVGQLQLVNGIKTNYFNTRNNSNNFISNTSGLNANLYTGINFPICQNFDIGVEVPVFNFSTSTTKSQISQKYSDTDVSLLLNKDNLAKILLRMRLGN